MKRRTDVITHLRTHWPPGDAVQFTGPDATGSLDKQPEGGKGTGGRKTKRGGTRPPGRSFKLRAARPAVRCTYFSLEKLEEAGMLEMRDLVGSEACSSVSLQGYFGLSIHLSPPNLTVRAFHHHSGMDHRCCPSHAIHRFAPSWHILPVQLCAAASLWSRVWPSAHRFLQLPRDSLGVSTASSSANWDCRSPTWQPVISLSSQCCTSNLSAERNISTENPVEIMTYYLLRVLNSPIPTSEETPLFTEAKASSFPMAAMFGCWIYTFSSTVIFKCPLSLQAGQSLMCFLPSLTVLPIDTTSPPGPSSCQPTHGSVVLESRYIKEMQGCRPILEAGSREGGLRASPSMVTWGEATE
ncbi:uncharacterized protein LOC116540585 isoform X1 [Sapajus apella]|uniref:Uncharacterized protein LOC116540585 isoform X1 n=1 Tax=Sapajus apella TaxID=9515 RepID=A0A6J3GPG8_SAPAP|nr:uncharacterized protein LOC116540585 isoform X1 [Sapajus apella]